jgi:lipopolysaccharide/colanic/teichoic acid biosynthesis glycosyltransferase
MITRATDIIISLVGLLILLILLPWIAFLIKFDSKGPVFYRCRRVGQGGKIFQMYKFRTMYEMPMPVGPGLSPRGDPRVTPVGLVLRRLKLNELPQFINILKGDMTLIGPRPEAPELAAVYPATARRIFEVKPGLAGPNQILGRNEEELYPPGVDPVQYYIEHLLPRKLPLDLEYIDNKSLFKDFAYLFLACKVTITGAFNRRHLWEKRHQILLMISDLCCCVLSFSLAHFLRYEGYLDQTAVQILPILLVFAVVFRLPLFVYFGLYHSMIRHLSFYDIKQICKAVGASSLLLVVMSFFFELVRKYSRGVFLIDFALLTMLLISSRVLLQKIALLYRSSANGKGKRRRVLIWGAGDAGELCLRYLNKDQQVEYEPVGFIDDDPRKRYRRLNGVKVLGDRHHLATLAQLYGVEEVVLAVPSAPAADLHEIMGLCGTLGIKTSLFNPSATRPTRRSRSSLRPVTSYSLSSTLAWSPLNDPKR